MYKKNILNPLFLLLILFFVAACSEVNDTSSQQSSEDDVQEVVPEDSDSQSEKDDGETAPVVNEEPEVLSDAEIRVVMDKFQKIEDIVKETNSKMTFSDEESTQSEVMAAKLQENLPESIKELVSSEMLNKELPEELQYWYYSSGEDGFFPEVSLDARMEVIENTPQFIKVKTFQLNDFFQWHGNVYITAVNENGQWLIDGGYEWVDVDKEPLDLSKEELLIHEETINDSEIEFIAEETITSTLADGTSKTANAIIVKIVKDNMLKGRFTDTGEVVNELPEKFKSAE
ncbi:hypothetical protein HMPREF1210_02127 [Paenisporosarcina sp. HGH0030]|uniref:hypothetical protein n=1 Tax=Paenisporosarcina sp. HGH0030 TaxID=1078085 RepID=UPI00034E4731|nr:hypothetical protein [Paenisporosarcina sp. HGH0030]EPD51529.1 hypothetical protein HMPREF1210_02127 [Paenisporosarcina sp. HGH0030]